MLMLPCASVASFSQVRSSYGTRQLFRLGSCAPDQRQLGLGGSRSIRVKKQNSFNIHL